MEDHVETEEEGKRRMEEVKRVREERQRQEMEEFAEMRKEEKEKERAEIEQLRIRREERKKQRAEEDRRLKELQKIEEARRKAEEEIRKRKKAVEEEERREEIAKLRREAEEKMRPRRPNYVITKKDKDFDIGTTFVPPPLKTVQVVQKSKEELEMEKKQALAQRIQPLNEAALKNKNDWTAKIKELYEHMRKLVANKYDLEQKYKRMQYDVIELQERARQMTKGKKGKANIQVDETFDRLADRYSGAPPKIKLCSKYERHKERLDFPKYIELFTEFQTPNWERKGDRRAMSLPIHYDEGET